MVTVMILLDPCIVDYVVETTTRCGFVIEFIIPQFFEGSTCFERHNAHHQELIQFRALDDERCTALNMLSPQKTLEYE